MTRTANEQLTKFISDLYAMELQSREQLEKAPDLVSGTGLRDTIETHRKETERQVERLGHWLEERNASPSKVKDGIMKLGGKGFALFAKLQSETPGRMLAHTYAYNAMESAGYELLRHFAEAVDERETASVARKLQTEEQEMLKRLEEAFDAAEEDAHGGTPPEEVAEHVLMHLAEAHALGAQGVKLLEQGVKSSDDDQLKAQYHTQLAAARRSQDEMEKRLTELGGSRSVVEDAAMKLGALNWGLFFRSQSDSPAKLAAFTYAVGHLQIAGQELLKRTARRVNDEDTAALCERTVTELRTQAEAVAGLFGVAAEASLREMAS